MGRSPRRTKPQPLSKAYLQELASPILVCRKKVPKRIIYKRFWKAVKARSSVLLEPDAFSKLMTCGAGRGAENVAVRGSGRKNLGNRLYKRVVRKNRTRIIRCPRATRRIVKRTRKTLLVACQTRSKVLHGPWFHWKHGGTAYGSLTLGSYHNGKKSGRWIGWYIMGLGRTANVVESRLTDYLAGKKHGAFASAQDLGEDREQGLYRHGKKHGTWTYNGTVSQVYKNGKKHGKYESRDSAGDDSTEGFYRNGKKHGLWKRWEGRGEEYVDRALVLVEKGHYSCIWAIACVRRICGNRQLNSHAGVTSARLVFLLVKRQPARKSTRRGRASLTVTFAHG